VTSRVDTIAAPATPAGRSALAIVRIDGPASAALLRAISRAEVDPEVRKATFARLWDPKGELLDECIAIRYEAPHSFTGNDLVELTLHGNPLLVERVLDVLVRQGARLAEPGEFSERAVLNGKLDLVQAESIAELINARTALQAKLSLSNLEGTLSRSAEAVRSTLLDVISRLEAALDFSEEGYEFIKRDEAGALLRDAMFRLGEMAATYERGRATSRGLEAVILGRPNAGKSTLLNRLVGTDRAIVTELPGTTRDIVRETIEIGGLPVTLADTAGLRAGGDTVEEIGIARARAAALEADLVIYLVDATEGMSSEDRAEIAGLNEVLVVYNKSDLAAAPTDELSISAQSGLGFERLLQSLDSLVRSRFAASEGALVNERQRGAVSDCVLALEAASAGLDSGLDEELVLVDLYAASTALGRLTGAITNDEVLGQIFGSFCIGK
jgi:tRNA modification GTPase